MNIFLLFTLSVLLGRCVYNEIQYNRFNRYYWSVKMSPIQYYPASDISVVFFNNGNYVESIVINNSFSSQNYSSSDNNPKFIPDSISIKWSCMIDKLKYEGGAKLSQEKMLKLFHFPQKNLENYSQIIGKVAPGGNVTFWMETASNKEIIKFKAKNIGIWKENNTKDKNINSEANIFRYLHGIPYKVWEKGEPEYDWDTGFTTEESNKGNYHRAITYFTKDGSAIYGDTYERSEEITSWGETYGKPNNNREKKAKLPVHIFLQWSSPNRQNWYEAEIVLPSDFEKRFTTPYTDSATGKLQNYNRIIVGMDREETDKLYTFGRIWLDGPGKQEEIMKFRAAKLDVKTREYSVSLYSIPKGFVFPKWEGREPLTTPDVEFWQEK